MTPSVEALPGVSAVPSYVRNGPLVRLDKISFSRGDVPILRDVNATIHNIVRPPPHTQGQVVALLGPSGVGKTTLLEIMAGLLEPDSGRVLVGTEQTPVTAGRVGYVTQRSVLFEHHKVLTSLIIAALQAGIPPAELKPVGERFRALRAEGLAETGRPGLGPKRFLDALAGALRGPRWFAAREKARKMLERFNLTAQAGHYPVQLSVGQRQRVAIAEQTLCSDHVIIMDEPVAALDPNAVAKVVKLITELAAEDELNTIVLSTHDIRTAIAVADTLWVMGRAGGGNDKTGATILREFDTIERGLAWHPDVERQPAFEELYQEVRALFRTL